jgi:hypothetical protein
VVRPVCALRTVRTIGTRISGAGAFRAIVTRPLGSAGAIRSFGTLGTLRSVSALWTLGTIRSSGTLRRTWTVGGGGTIDTPLGGSWSIAFSGCGLVTLSRLRLVGFALRRERAFSSSAFSLALLLFLRVATLSSRTLALVRLLVLSGRGGARASRVSCSS